MMVVGNTMVIRGRKPKNLVKRRVRTTVSIDSDMKDALVENGVANCGFSEAIAAVMDLSGTCPNHGVELVKAHNGVRFCPVCLPFLADERAAVDP